MWVNGVGVLASLAETVSSRFNGRPCLKIKRCGTMENNVILTSGPEYSRTE